MNAYVSSTRAANLTISNVHRAFYFLTGMGLVITVLISPPVNSLWIAIASMLAIGLVTLSIIRQKPQVRIPVGNRVINTRLLHTLFSASVGLGIIILSMADPPLSITWLAFFNFLGIAILFDTLIGSEYMFKPEGRQFLIKENKTWTQPAYSGIRFGTGHAV
ncbi:MAG: hypothetical protein GXP19_04845 [Gammaproteobacteria bacterium]|nr:hypothetical protein [Gammaproteobacteria bacterium]